MSIQKKSLLNSLNTTKKAIVASSTPANEETPKVSKPVTGRVYLRKMGRKSPATRGRVTAL